MENNQFQLSFTTELNKGLTLTPLRQAFIQDDNQAHVFTIHTTRNGAANALTGSTIKGFFIPYGLDVTVELSGEVNAAGAAVVSLTQDCYAFVGRFNLVIQAINSASTASVFYGEGYVTKTRTDKVIEPSGASPSLGALEERINNLTYSDVGAAPSGYGLGEVQAPLPPNNNTNDIIQSGFYLTNPETDNAPSEYGVILAVARDITNITLMGEITHTSCIRLERRKVYGTWGEWEYVNPPMVLGVEYRTTERWNGKAVYTQLINCGELAVGVKDVVTTVPVDATIIRYEAFYTTTAGSVIDNPAVDYATGDTIARLTFNGSRNIVIVTYGNGLSGTAVCQVWYTKS